jgi:hypothetical protein
MPLTAAPSIDTPAAQPVTHQELGERSAERVPHDDRGGVQHYFGHELRHCWPSHVHAVWELSTLAAAWQHAYGGQRPVLARALEFYDRWLPGTSSSSRAACCSPHTTPAGPLLI